MHVRIALAAFISTLIACTAQPPSSPAPAVLSPAVPTAPAAAKKHPPLAAYTAYDATKDVAAQVTAAQAVAKGSNKRVLVMFGGNWCKWCKALDALFTSDANVSTALDDGFVLVHVDSDSNGALNDRWGNPFANGFPVLVVVDVDGKKLHVQETGALEKEDKSVAHDADKVITFLKRWSPPA
jgi:thiol:disulfide interchange protein